MCKLVQVAAMVLISASAEAARSRSLSLASLDDQVATWAKPDINTAQTSATPAQPTAIYSAETVTTETPKFVEPPPGVTMTAPTAATMPAQPQQSDSAKPAALHTASRGKHRITWTETRIISELHRHGIYWCAARQPLPEQHIPSSWPG
jgi:hypothetical protein